ncbi:hypothetical protein [Caballeronia novacaledonica]|uniref:hypothetical protein n=1 Tax=Caballeronia novacaledonica TaxID=1544861 RepID=UPI0011B25FF5|nr:hypothetical protein [Caballeronia novacaledonica]
MVKSISPRRRVSKRPKQHFVDLWVKQSELFWRTVYSVPLIASAVFAGWYALEVADQERLAGWLLTGGVLVMAIQVAVLHRMAVYLNVFRRAADTLIPRVSEPPFGLSGFRIGVAVPVLVMLFFIALRVINPDLNKPETVPGSKQRFVRGTASSGASTPEGVASASGVPSASAATGCPGSK